MRNSAQCDDRARARLWSAELAIELDAAGIIVIDGSGFDAIAWRRLQLAVSKTRERELGHGPIRNGISHPAAVCNMEWRSGPLVIVVTPPEDPSVQSVHGARNERRSQQPRHRLRTAATQWTVCAEVFDQARCAHEADRCPESDGHSEFDDRLRLCWRMELAHVRGGMGGQSRQSPIEGEAAESHSQNAALYPEHGMRIALHDGPRRRRDALVPIHAAIASRALSVFVGTSRTICADGAWQALREYARSDRRLAAMQGTLSEHLGAGMAVHSLRRSQSGADSVPGALETELFTLPSSGTQRLGWEVRSA